jgi:hypothetical protein
VAPPVGQAGIRYCNGDDEAPLSREAALGAAFTATTLRFSAGGASFQADERRGSVAVSFEQRFADRWTFEGSAGSSTGGSLRTGHDSFALRPGPLAAASISCRALTERKALPFVLVSLSAAGSWGESSPRGGGSTSSLVSTDARLGIAAGKTIAQVLSIYGVGRAFGGPVFWTYEGHDATGTDTHHYQVGFGFSLAVRRFDVHLEMAPLGERELAAGAGVAF